VVALWTAGVILGIIGPILLVYLLYRSDMLAEGVAQRRVELADLKRRVELLERQMAADPSRTGGVRP
jgi:hypothetical protein